ncbi:hypothetical protein D3C78_1519040 [compost metagenome]
MQLIKHRDNGVVVDRLLHDQSLRQTIFRHIADTLAHCFTVVMQPHWLAVDPDFTAVRARHAEQAEAQLGAACAQQADDRDDLAAVQ